MLNKSISIFVLCLLTSSCSTFKSQNNYSKPNNLMYQNNKLEYKKINIKRDHKLCNDDVVNDQKCPIDLYIDDYKSGTFYINNEAKFYLKPDEYILKAKNCTKDCSKSELKIDLKNSLKDVNIILSIDADSKPLIIKN